MSLPVMSLCSQNKRGNLSLLVFSVWQTALTLLENVDIAFVENNFKLCIHVTLTFLFLCHSYFSNFTLPPPPPVWSYVSSMEEIFVLTTKGEKLLNYDWCVCLWVWGEKLRYYESLKLRQGDKNKWISCSLLSLLKSYLIFYYLQEIK